MKDPDFVTVKTTIPQWAFERYQLISKYRFFSVEHQLSQSLRGEILKTHRTPASEQEIQEMEKDALIEGIIDLKWEVISLIKALKAKLLGQKFPDLSPPFNTTLDTPCLVEFTVRRYWIHQIEKKVGKNPDQVSKEISKLLIDGLYTYFPAARKNVKPSHHQD